jgi:hypothetical protein
VGFALVTASAWLLGAAACGGESPPKHAPAERRQQAESEPDEEGESDEGTAAPARENTNICEDGSCFRCGQGICPTGFYCDEGVQGGAACSWLPSCPLRASCECVERQLGSGCSCEESGGGAKVSCG